MKEKKIIIGVSPELSDELLFRWKVEKRDSEQILGKAFPADIQILRARPTFPSKEQIEYLKSVGIAMPEPTQYRMYIGSDVDQVTEQVGGVELPRSVLETTEAFRKEVLLRLRFVIGAPEDN